MVRASSPMVRTCKWLAGVWMLAVGTAAWGAPAADAPSGGASGIYRVTFSIRLGQPLPAGGAIGLARQVTRQQLPIASHTKSRSARLGITRPVANNVGPPRPRDDRQLWYRA